MIVLDTNVVSALMQREPEPAVPGWLNGQSARSVWTTALTVFEIRLGLGRLEPGARRSGLEERFAGLVEQDLDGRVLDLDADAASSAALLASARSRAGRVQDDVDALIAGIVVARGATLATRNVRHFPDIPTVDPWRAGTPS